MGDILTLLAIMIIILMFRSYKQVMADKRDKIKKGKEGEQDIIKVLRLLPDTKIYSNLYMPMNKEKTKFTEIDILAINKAGIYVIESKNYGGVITGKPQDMQWRQKFANGRKVYLFYNPIRQNTTHCNSVKHKLYAYRHEVKSLIVFSDRADVTSVRKACGYSEVMNTKDLYNVIYNDIRNCSNPLTKEDIRIITKEINKYTNASWYTKKKHVRNIKRKHRKRGD